MSQTSYSRNLAAAFAGMKVDAGFDYVESFAAQAQLDFGLGVVAAQGDLGAVRKPLLNSDVLTLDADLIAANTFAFSLIVDGVTTAITATFATSHAATMGVIRSAVAAVSGVLSATLSGANRVLTIIGDNVTVDTIGAAVTGGVSQAGVVETRSTADSLVRGIALHEHKQASTQGFLATESVPVQRRGKVWVPVVDTVADGDDVYISYAAGSEGKFRNDSTNALQLTSAKFRSAAVSGELAIVEVNQP